MAREYVELYGLPALSAQAPRTEAEPVRIDLRRLLGAMRRRLWWVAATCLLFLALGATFLALSAPRYVATSQIIIDPRGLRVLDNEVTPPAQSSESTVPIVESEMRVLKSTRVLEAVVNGENLAEDPEFNGSRTSLVGAVTGTIKGAVTWFLGTPPKPRGDPRTGLLATLDDRIAVRRAERSFVVDVTVFTEDAEKSARIANALVKAYVRISTETQAEAASRSGRALEANLEAMQSKVRQAEERAEQYKAKNNLVGAAGRLVSDQQLADLNQQLGRTRTQTLEAKAKIDQLARLQRGGFNDVGAFAEAVQSPTVAGLRLQLAETRRRYANLETKLGSRHPELAEARREMGEAQSGISAEVARLAQTARADYERSRDAERSLQATLDASSRSAVTTSRALVQLRELEREAEASRTVYNAALVRNRQLQEQALLDSTNVRQITPASPPLRPSNPSAALILAIALAAGLLVGGAGVFTARALDPTVRSDEDLERASGLSVISIVPRGPEGPGATGILPHQRAYLGLIDATSVGQRGHLVPGSISVTSVDPDGTSAFVAFNLARAAASTGAQVLLIDASVEQRRLTQTLDCEGRDGLGACASGEADLDDAVVPVPGAGVDFLPADLSAAQHLRRVGSAGLPGLVREALSQYSLVVIDLGCATREPLARTAGAAEAGLLVVEEGESTYPAVQSAIAACRAAKIRLAGLTLLVERARPA